MLKCYKILSRQSTNALMTASRHVVVKLLTVIRMSKVEYHNKVNLNLCFQTLSIKALFDT